MEWNRANAFLVGVIIGICIVAVGNIIHNWNNTSNMVYYMLLCLLAYIITMVIIFIVVQNESDKANSIYLDLKSKKNEKLSTRNSIHD